MNERERLGLRGLLPPRVVPMDVQLQRIKDGEATLARSPAASSLAHSHAVMLSLRRVKPVPACCINGPESPEDPRLALLL